MVFHLGVLRTMAECRLLTSWRDDRCLGYLPTDRVDKPVEGLAAETSSGSQQWLFCPCLESGRDTRLSRYAK